MLLVEWRYFFVAHSPVAYDQLKHTTKGCQGSKLGRYGPGCCHTNYMMVITYVLMLLYEFHPLKKFKVLKVVNGRMAGKCVGLLGEAGPRTLRIAHCGEVFCQLFSRSFKKSPRHNIFRIFAHALLLITTPMERQADTSLRFLFQTKDGPEERAREPSRR